MASAPASPWHRDRAGVLRFAGGALLVAVVCWAAACSLDANGFVPSTQSAAGGGGQGNGTGSNAGGYGGSLTISAGGGSVASTTGTAGGEGGAGGAGGGNGGGGGEFVCEGDRVFEDPDTGHCYYNGTDKQNWLNARANCKLWGGPSADLAAISSSEEYLVVTTSLALIPMPKDHVWLGGRDVDPMDPAVGYEWSNGEPWGFAPQVDPPVPEEAKPCIKLHMWVFEKKECSEGREYLCERY